MEQREKEAPKAPEKPREPFLSKTTLIVVGAVVAIQLVVLAIVLWPRLFPPKAEAPAEAEAQQEKDATVELGKIEVSKADDPLQQSFTRVIATVYLVVPAEKATEMREKITAVGPVLKESARQAFRDADSKDLATENVAGVKNAIKTRINQELGEDVVTRVVFPEYRAY